MTDSRQNQAGYAHRPPAGAEVSGGGEVNAAAIVIDRVSKQYPNGVRALDDLSLTVKRGEIFSLLGPNGAGKSSLIRILTTFYQPTAGKVTILGHDLCREPAWVRSRIACVAQQISLDSHLSPLENMLFQSRLYHVDARTAKQRIQTLIRDFELAEWLERPVGSLSGGVKRRLDIAMNMVSYPGILFLDEPTTGMDVESRQALWRVLRRIRDEYGTTIFLTTHYLEEAEHLSDTICMLKNGREAAQGTPDALRSYTGRSLLRIACARAEDCGRCREALAAAGLVEFAQVRGQCIVAGVKTGSGALPAVAQWLLGQRVDFTAIETVRPSLEDVFLALTGSAAKREEGCSVC